MYIFKGTLPGLLILLGLFCFADAQTCPTIANCSQCAGTICLSCNDGFAQNEGTTGCCSKGCPTDENSYHLCNVNTALCSYEGCLSGYYGPYCLPCTSKIQNCDNCGVVQGSTDTVECITCATGFFETTDNQHCCPMGCDSCTGASGTICTSCKASYFLYNQKCDTCGNNCVEPTDGSARCNPVTGSCYLGCKDGWHGSKCDVQCTRSRCDRCTYDEPTMNLTCADCNSGYYGPFCEACSATCASVANGDLCTHEGTCSNGCLPGYRGNKCDITCESATNLQNCLECERYAFTCTKCKAGFWGPQCQNNCHANCVEFQGARSCTINNGTCDYGCLATHYKMDCSGSCPNCGNDVCERETGVCLDPICDAGFWGRNCNNSCPAHCRPQTLQGVATCNFQNGNCTTGCTDGNWGEFCNEGCSVNCALSPQATETGPLCTQSDGTCVHQCKAGSYRPDCSETCQSECVTGACDITDGICVECRAENPGYLCPEGICKPVVNNFFSGINCSRPCPENCESSCARYSGNCDACEAGFWSPTCDNTCGNCKEVACSQNNGMCLSDCVDGFYGQMCDTVCVYEGCESCDRNSGECVTCKQGLWGENCENSCSPACLPNEDDLIFCDKETSICSVPACVDGYYSARCMDPCSANCFPPSYSTSGIGTCGFESGICDDGCNKGWFGDFCDTRCSSSCVESTCYRDGRCDDQLGCVERYFGFDCTDTCTGTCNDNSCDRNDGICTECLKPVEERTPRCRTATCSPVNTWGVFCEYTCPVNCADGTCSREDGTCSSCKAGKHGDRCDQDCPNCATNACDQDSGICLDSCKDGWYQLDCMSKCKHEGCQTCERNDGECVTCKAGTYGQNCSMVCARTCALGTNGQITCNRFTGQCDMNACRSGYYTPTCTEECSAFCQSGSCDLEAGTCSPCINGWYGQKCDGQCSTRCKNKDCETTEASCRQGCTDGYWGSSCEKVCNVNCAGKACNKETAQCLYGCNGSNFYGLTCLEPCNVNCIDKVCNRTGYCQRECVTGWYGDKCQYQCTEVSKCTDGKCSRLGGICEDCLEENPGSNCPSAECPSGKRGQQCEDDCTSSNCLYNQCGRYTDKCNGCPSGLYGDKCELTCSNCRTGTGCDQATGECNVGCKDGWFEPDCETKCDTKCGSCDRLTGECITCAVASWGPDCGRLCSSNCVETHVSGNHFVLCDKNTGHCEEQACKVGHWREDCTQNCSINCLPDENNNRVCAYLNGECARGCKKTFFGRTCGFLCSTRCRDQLCTNFADTCDLGCTDGYYGATCASVCSSHCAGDGGCNPSTGACYDGCEKGYYGTRCIDPCKNTCVDGFCDATEGGCADCRIDPVGPNCRIQLCDPGLYGPTCESKCPGNYCLNNQCKRTSGDCNTGCLNGYYGAYCAGVCQCDAEGTVECEQTKGECICKVGSRGTLCDLPCSSGCDDLACERDGTCSNGCISGRYGARCEDPCSNCMNQACNAANGVCLQGCIEGWYGTQCNMPCGSECKACDVQTGLCTSCANDFYSLPQCDRTCSSNCKIQGTGRQCNQATGDCMYGCVTGYYSLKCSESCGRCGQCDPADGSCPVCNAGWWGTTCKNQCSPYCARGGSSNERMCRQSDGFCEFGCDAGYYGDSCASQCIGQNCLNGGCHRQIGTCTSGCQPYFYDTNCDQRCNTCKNGLCNQVNGYCTEDCPANSYGNKCDKECLTPLCVDATCERYSGYCADCQTSPKGPNCAVQDPVTPAALVAAEELTMGSIIGITVGSVAFVIIFVVVFVCCMNYKRRYDDAKSETRFPPEFIEPLPSHRSLQGTASTIYPVARVVDDSEKDFVLF